MSQTHIRMPKPPARRRIGHEIAICAICFLVIPVAYWLIKGWYSPARDSATADVLETRIVVSRYRESGAGGQIYYQLEAHIRNDGHGLPETIKDQWLKAADETSTRELLLVLQQRHSAKCRVYWIPNHPETARCELL
jgi:hypothetical protein